MSPYGRPERPIATPVPPSRQLNRPRPERLPVQPPPILHRPRARLLIDDTYPVFDALRDKDIVKDILEVCPNRNKFNFPRPLPDFEPKPRIPDYNYVRARGKRTLKRRAESSEFDLIAEASPDSSGKTVAIFREGTPSSPGAALDNTVPPSVETAPVADQPPAGMLAGFSFRGTINKMFSTVRSAYSAIRDAFIKELRAKEDDRAYRIQELRNCINGRDVTNKRRKLSHGDGAPIYTWIDTDDMHNLDNAFRQWLANFHAFEMILHAVRGLTMRAQLNEKLEKFRYILLGRDGYASYVPREWDLVKIFEIQIGQVRQFVTPFYNIGDIVKLKTAYPDVTAYQPPNPTVEQREIANINKVMLSSPIFIKICRELIEICGADNIEIHEDFFNTILMDTDAFTNQLPLPSYVRSEEYRRKFLEAFPLPARLNLEDHVPLPGSFPRDEAVPTQLPTPPETPLVEPQLEYRSPSPEPQLEPSTPSPQRGLRPESVRSPSPAPQSPEPIIKPTNNKKTEHMRVLLTLHDLKASSPKTRHRKYYKTSTAHQLISQNYIDEFTPRQPNHAGIDVNSIASILRDKRKRDVRKRGPKRLSMQRAPQKVRFTESTLSPRPRTHTGLDVPRIFDGREEVDACMAEAEAEAAEAEALAPPATPTTPTTPYRTVFPRSVYLSPEKEITEDEEAAFRARVLEILDESTHTELRPLMMSDSIRKRIAKEKEEIAMQAAEEARRIEEAARIAREAQEQRELEERLARTGGLRLPKRHFVEDVSDSWMRRAQDTLRASATTTLATTGEGVDLRRHDFAKVVNKTEWLNDEIVNASLNWLDRAINQANGIKDVKRHTRKCYALSSFFWKRLQENGVGGTQRTLRRCGVTKDNILDIDTILLPICDRAHWTLMVIRPSKRTIAHMDSLNPRGSPAYTSLALNWMKNVLENKFVDDEWKVVNHESPAQLNGYDCGIFTITNAMCLALGLNPIDCYDAEDMPAQRIRIACMLLNGGFKGDFDLAPY
ncbi:hypothetical protein B0I35DRAFT_411908 [Stachybotrys elegans]|uniref:Ubiquitin-like protease family profile domain-containing protein n=1 Tax=Stachybotrys elegans TaxID=80388 RepID=A0A8K0SLP7_9HYPO|nr:hypothetical protein B0I35DRAFT_411908 [Stachybotrys elegans]